jgi:hypothetical protein
VVAAELLLEELSLESLNPEEVVLMERAWNRPSERER